MSAAELPIRAGDTIRGMSDGARLQGVVLTVGPSKIQIRTPNMEACWGERDSAELVGRAQPAPPEVVARPEGLATRHVLIRFARRLRDRTEGQRGEEAVLLHNMATHYLDLVRAS